MIQLKRVVWSLVASGVVALFVACGGSSTSGPAPTATLSPLVVTPIATSSLAAPTPGSISTGTPPARGGSSQVIQVGLRSQPYIFIPDTFTFQTGKTYTLRFPATNDFHTFTVTGLGLDILIFPGQAKEQTVTFNDVGRFQLICTIHEDLEMKGTITITQGP